MTTTRTLGPLHFEDLDPRRFEDLVRQLIYDYKLWRRLEATGRAGSDDGFDARGYEMRAASSRTEISASEVDEDEGFILQEDTLVEGHDDRLWLVQCKRERAIGPKKLAGYLDEIALTEREKLHGIVFAAACDFSKKARDEFAVKCRAIGSEEWHLWGKAELEDRLFRPECDHLLFAYFGISLTIRRRAQRADLRAKLVTKRKAARLLKKHERSRLLLRSPEAPTYPNPEDVRDPETGQPPWAVREYRGLCHGGLLFCTRKYFAFLHDDGEQWDAAMAFNDARRSGHEDPWHEKEDDYDLRGRIHDAWSAFPRANQAWLEVLAIVPFEDVIDIDELGDEFFGSPHVYAPFVHGQNGPFTSAIWKIETIETYNTRTLYLEHEDVGRITVFGEEMRIAEPVSIGASTAS